jgi:hypothetical protein
MLGTVFDQLGTAAPRRLFPREALLDSLKLTCAAALFASPWVFDLPAVATWNLWVCGYAMMSISLVALVAEADWEPGANFWLGAWIMAAPWMVGFFEEPEATFVHMAGGGVVLILSAVELWTAERNPPWRFRPGAALRVSRTPAETGMPQAERLFAAHDPIFARRRGSVPPRRPFPRLRGTPANILLRGRRRGPRCPPYCPGRHPPSRAEARPEFRIAAGPFTSGFVKLSGAAEKQLRNA